MTKNDIIKLALDAGFDKYESWCLSGNSKDDRLVAVAEYPVGESVIKFAGLVAAAEREACAKCVPTSWLDPLLTGKGAVIGDVERMSVRELEALLLAVKQRIDARSNGELKI